MHFTHIEFEMQRTCLGIFLLQCILRVEYVGSESLPQCLSIHWSSGNTRTFWSTCAQREIDACQPGTYLSNKCNSTCLPCLRHTYMPDWNNCSSCLNCTRCDDNGAQEDCTAESDAVCVVVPPGSVTTMSHPPETTLSDRDTSSTTQTISAEPPHSAVYPKRTSEITTSPSAEVPCGETPCLGQFDQKNEGFDLKTLVIAFLVLIILLLVLVILRLVWKFQKPKEPRREDRAQQGEQDAANDEEGGNLAEEVPAARQAVVDVNNELENEGAVGVNKDRMVATSSNGVTPVAPGQSVSAADDADGEESDRDHEGGESDDTEGQESDDDEGQERGDHEREGGDGHEREEELPLQVTKTRHGHTNGCASAIPDGPAETDLLIVTKL